MGRVEKTFVKLGADSEKSFLSFTAEFTYTFPDSPPKHICSDFINKTELQTSNQIDFLFPQVKTKYTYLSNRVLNCG